MKSPFSIIFIIGVAFFMRGTSAASAEKCLSEEEGQGECANPGINEEDPQCPSRELIIRCAGQTLDTNQNGKLDRSELQSAIDSLPWYARGILQILGSTNAIMKKCDLDGDDAIRYVLSFHIMRRYQPKKTSALFNYLISSLFPFM